MSGKRGIWGYIELIKFNLCAYISLSAVFGQVMADQQVSASSFFIGVWVCVLACGSAVLNNIQDREYDLFFPRTRNRVLPSKRIPVFKAGIFAVVLISAGLAGLYLFYGQWPFVYGILAVLCYNALYTPLKKKSLLAIVPGSLTGMLAPLIGWASAHHNHMAKQIILIMGIFGLWQIAHFLIILLKGRKHFPQGENSTGFPCLTKIFSENEIKVQALIWTSLYSLAMTLFLICGPITSDVLSVFTGLNALVVLFTLVFVLVQQKRARGLIAFVAINLSMLSFMLAGIGDKFFL